MRSRFRLPLSLDFPYGAPSIDTYLVSQVVLEPVSKSTMCYISVPPPSGRLAVHVYFNLPDS